jgi:cobalt-zinc-cadmium efflux system protein
VIAFQTEAAKRRGRLAAALAIAVGVAALELAGAYLSGSLALFADAAHLVNDILGLGMALAAVYLGERAAATPRKTFGYYRAEVLVAALNAVLLFGVAAYILYESLQRLAVPPRVAAVPMLVVATVGLAANLVSMRLLREGAGVSLTLRSAFLEVASDALASAGVLAAGLILLLTGWPYADPLVAAAIAFLIVPRTWRLLRSSLDVLLEGTPAHIDLGAVRSAMLSAPHVVDVHDLHVWTITSGFVALSAHVGVERMEFAPHALHECTNILRERFGIEHTTLQVEPHVPADIAGGAAGRS